MLYFVCWEGLRYTTYTVYLLEPLVVWRADDTASTLASWREIHIGQPEVGVGRSCRHRMGQYKTYWSWLANTAASKHTCYTNPWLWQQKLHNNGGELLLVKSSTSWPQSKLLGRLDLDLACVFNSCQLLLFNARSSASNNQLRLDPTKWMPHLACLTRNYSRHFLSSFIGYGLSLRAPQLQAHVLTPMYKQNSISTFSRQQHYMHWNHTCSRHTCLGVFFSFPDGTKIVNTLQVCSLTNAASNFQ